jgi:hypothetical protein
MVVTASASADEIATSPVRRTTRVPSIAPRPPGSGVKLTTTVAGTRNATITAGTETSIASAEK